MNYNFKDTELIVYDFDGVMTDNTAYVFEDGREAVRVNRADGLGIQMIKKMGFRQMILSTEANKVVAARAQKLGIECLHGIEDKATEIKQLCDKQGLSLDKIVYVGNDINDEESMRLVGMPIAPADANEAIIKLSRMVFKTRGGQGVVRELADIISNSKTKI